MDQQVFLKNLLWRLHPIAGVCVVRAAFSYPFNTYVLGACYALGTVLEAGCRNIGFLPSGSSQSQ